MKNNSCHLIINGVSYTCARILLALLTCLLGTTAQTLYADTKNAESLLLDFNLYPYLDDVDSDNVFTLNVAAKLGNGFSYFGLLNLGNQSDRSELGDITNFYTEQSVRWQVNDSPIDLTAQFNFRSGEDNDRHRLGFRWRLNDTAMLKEVFQSINLAWSINFHVFQFDHADENIWQMEHVFRLTAPQISDRLYIAGFIDHTFNEDLPGNFPDNPIVGEVQLGWRLIENLYAITEYRVNEYRRSDVNNLAVGIEYKIKL